MPPLAPLMARPAAPPRVGLIASALTVDELEVRWEQGFEIEPEGCGESGTFDPCLSLALSDGTRAAKFGFVPFGVWAQTRCSTAGFSERDWQGRATRHLLACESRQIAHELWRGSLAKVSNPAWPNRYLAHQGSDVVTAGAASPAQALQCLEAGLADCACGSRGMIHAPRDVVLRWSENGLVRREGNLILTINDTIVVGDAGYDGSSPNDVSRADGSVWAYATDMVEVRRGKIEVVPSSLGEALDRSDNTIRMRALRIAAATWSGCCWFAAEINLPLCGIAGAGS